jgi:transcriptional regulator with XRE-family HTH domain
MSRNIKELRAKSGLSQEDMGEFGFELRRYQRIENGEYNITLQTLVRLAEAFKVDISDLLRN